MNPAQFIGKAQNPKPSGSFYEPRKGGEYWSCGGLKRSWAAVTASDACVSGGWFGKKRPAKFKGKAQKKKPSGSFYDPRRGGEYWSCRGWDRSPHPVTSKKACVKIYQKLPKSLPPGLPKWTNNLLKCIPGVFCVEKSAYAFHPHLCSPNTVCAMLSSPTLCKNTIRRGIKQRHIKIVTKKACKCDPLGP